MNNNRRSFFKSLAMLGAAAAGCPGIFVPKFEPVRWKVHTRGFPVPYDYDALQSSMVHWRLDDIAYWGRVITPDELVLLKQHVVDCVFHTT